MSTSIQQATCVPNLKNLSWFMRPWLQKIGLTYFWLWTRSKWPNCDAIQTRHVMPPTECIYQVSNWYLKACWRKVRKTRTDGRTDGRTLPRHNTSRFSNGRIKMRNILLGNKINKTKLISHVDLHWNVRPNWIKTMWLIWFKETTKRSLWNIGLGTSQLQHLMYRKLFMLSSI